MGGGRKNQLWLVEIHCFPQYWAAIQTQLEWQHPDIMWLLIFSEQYIKEKWQIHRKLSTRQGPQMLVPQASVSFFVSLAALTTSAQAIMYNSIKKKEEKHDFIY